MVLYKLLQKISDKNAAVLSCYKSWKSLKFNEVVRDRSKTIELPDASLKTNYQIYLFWRAKSKLVHTQRSALI